MVEHNILLLLGYRYSPATISSRFVQRIFLYELME